MAADVNFKSPSITNLDAAAPYFPNSAGLGGKGFVQCVKDIASPTAAGLAAVGSYYRLVRIPTWAKMTALWVATDRALDTNAANTLAFDIGLAFSDSLNDFTPSAVQGAVPTTANNGTVTPFATYASPNKLFGSLTPTMQGHTAAYGPTNLLLNGAITTTYPMASILNMPLWQLFGFVDARGYPIDPGGFFDVYMYITAVAATPAAGNLMVSAEFSP